MRSSQQWLTVNNGLYHRGMKKTTAIKKAGSAYRLAKLLNISKQAVSKWPRDIPPLREMQLKEMFPEWFPAKK